MVVYMACCVVARRGCCATGLFVNYVFMDKHTSLGQLVVELRRYAHLLLVRGRFLAVARLSYLIAAVAFVIIVVPIVVAAICYFSFSLLHLLLICLSPAMAHALVGVTLLLVALLVYVCRKWLLLNPITRMIALVMLDDNDFV